LPGKGPDAVVVVRELGGRLRDLAWAPDEDVEVDAVAANTDDGRAVIRHSAAHVLAQAVQQQFPDAKLGIGPPVRDGFYYDFDTDRPFTPDDLQALEKRMNQIVKGAQRFSRRVVDSIDAAKQELAAEPYKLELVDLKSDVDSSEVMEVDAAGELTIYDNLDRAAASDCGATCAAARTCRHEAHPGVQADQGGRRVLARQRAQPTAATDLRTAWESKEGADEHLALLAEAERRDHRRLAPNWTCSASPKSSDRVSPSSIRRAGSSGASWRRTHGAGTRSPATSS